MISMPVDIRLAIINFDFAVKKVCYGHINSMLHIVAKKLQVVADASTDLLFTIPKFYRLQN